MKFDFIGDIHGHATLLRQLLNKLGYVEQNGIYVHPGGRKAFFLGDYVDRGPEIIETLRIVRTMCDSGNAIALMGNHEYNLVCFFKEDPNGNYLRKHSINKIYQVLETLLAFKDKKQELNEYMAWILQLPVFYENEYFRAVHATWNNWAIKVVKQHLPQGNFGNEENLLKSVDKKSEFFYAKNTVLKGLEINLPNGLSFQISDYIKRHSIRVRWWEEKFDKLTYREIEANKMPQVPDIPLDTDKYNINDFLYKSDEKPVFFGHYWLSGEPQILRPNMCCLDYSVARGDKLVAYRYDGEDELSNDKLVWVNH